MSKREHAITEIQRRKISAIMRAADQQLARDAMKAAIAGGFRLAEVTLTTPGALDLISEFAENTELLIGAGTVLSTDQARQAVDAGAKFLVSPACIPQVIAEAQLLDVASIPGTFTATEMLTAHGAGADFVKLFPAPADVAEYVRSILAPLPHLRIVPTAGVSVDNLVAVLRAGAAGAGFTRTLFEPEFMSTRDFAAIERRAGEITNRLSEL